MPPKKRARRGSAGAAPPAVASPPQLSPLELREKELEQRAQKVVDLSLERFRSMGHTPPSRAKLLLGAKLFLEVPPNQVRGTLGAAGGPTHCYNVGGTDLTLVHLASAATYLGNARHVAWAETLFYDPENPGEGIAPYYDEGSQKMLVEAGDKLSFPLQMAAHTARRYTPSAPGVEQLYTLALRHPAVTSRGNTNALLVSPLPHKYDVYGRWLVQPELRLSPLSIAAATAIRLTTHVDRVWSCSQLAQARTLLRALAAGHRMFKAISARVQLAHIDPRVDAAAVWGEQALSAAYALADPLEVDPRSEAEAGADAAMRDGDAFAAFGHWFGGSMGLGRTTLGAAMSKAAVPLPYAHADLADGVAAALQQGMYEACACVGRCSCSEPLSGRSGSGAEISDAGLHRSRLAALLQTSTWGAGLFAATTRAWTRRRHAVHARARAIRTARYHSAHYPAAAAAAGASAAGAGEAAPSAGAAATQATAAAAGAAAAAAGEAAPAGSGGNTSSLLGKRTNPYRSAATDDDAHASADP